MAEVVQRTAGATLQRIECILPTLGSSPWLSDCLTALDEAAASWRAEAASREVRLTVVEQPTADGAPTSAAGISALLDGLPCLSASLHHIVLERPVGFAAACNRGMADLPRTMSAPAKFASEDRAEGSTNPPGVRASSRDRVAVAFVNDDVVVEPGWLLELAAALERDVRIASVQGLNHDQAGTRIDGLGLGFNRWYQAVQIRHGEAAAGYGGPDDLGARSLEGTELDVFGVSATAALFRLSALDLVSTAGRTPFDETLESFYEDADLAIRLRARHFSAHAVPRARTRHLGSATTGQQPRRKTELLYGNRLMVLRRALPPRAFGPLASALLRDLFDLARPPESSSRSAILAGWKRAVHLLRSTSSLQAGQSVASALRRPAQACLAPLPVAAVATPERSPGTGTQHPLLSVIVVHWHTEGELELLLERWRSLGHGTDSRFALWVIDNGSRTSLAPSCEAAGAHLVRAPNNPGFGAAVNLGVRASADSRSPWVLILNPDVLPEVGSLDALLQGLSRFPDAAGVAPSLSFSSGGSQAAWQLRPLPRRRDLVAQALFLPGRQGPQRGPAAGHAVEQPAAAALALRRDVLALLGGFDEGFLPAWFEDVDFAARVRDVGLTFRYWPEAHFVHRQGASVSALGYGRFLRIYTTNLRRYSRRRYGAAFAHLIGIAVRCAALCRALLLPLRRPRRAGSRSEAAKALLSLAFLSAETPRAGQVP
jgi:N-acetylglucosaminyl-diphospho-decaprenol L-rhamnosyltransferase